VARFFLGFSVASALWGAGLAALHFGLGWGPPPLEEAPVEVAVVEDEPAPEDDAPTGRRPTPVGQWRRRWQRRGAHG
jgi:hypothetical protein